MIPASCGLAYCMLTRKRTVRREAGFSPERAIETQALPWRKTPRQQGLLVSIGDQRTSPGCSDMRGR